MTEKRFFRDTRLAQLSYRLGKAPINPYGVAPERMVATEAPDATGNADRMAQAFEPGVMEHRWSFPARGSCPALMHPPSVPA